MSILYPKSPIYIYRHASSSISILWRNFRIPGHLSERFKESGINTIVPFVIQRDVNKGHRLDILKFSYFGPGVVSSLHWGRVYKSEKLGLE